MFCLMHEVKVKEHFYVIRIHSYFKIELAMMSDIKISFIQTSFNFLSHYYYLIIYYYSLYYLIMRLIFFELFRISFNKFQYCLFILLSTFRGSFQIIKN